MLIPLLSSIGEYCLLDVQEIVYLQTNGAGELTIYSNNERYRTINMVKDLALLLQDSGFIRLDRGTVVKTNSIKSFDPLLKVITIRTSSGEVLIPVSKKMQRGIRTYIDSQD